VVLEVRTYRLLPIGRPVPHPAITGAGNDDKC
jgi:hypothetical protein